MVGIFVSYRRDDTQGWAGRLARALQESFPKTQVFYDIATLQPGDDFPGAIDRALSSCQAALMLIGPRWLSAQTRNMATHYNPDDIVRLRSLPRLPAPSWLCRCCSACRDATAASLPEVLQPLLASRPRNQRQAGLAIHIAAADASPGHMSWQ
jgi:hypothetical protein